MDLPTLDEMIAIQDQVFGAWLRRIREIRGVSLWAAARATKIHSRRLYHIENGNSEKGITMREASLLANYYDIKLEAVVDMALGKPSE